MAESAAGGRAGAGGSLRVEELRPLAGRLREANAAFAGRYPGEAPVGQPVHTVYGGAHLFRADTARKLGEIARRAFDEHAADAASLARALALPGAERLNAGGGGLSFGIERGGGGETAAPEDRETWLAVAVHRRVADKLRRQPVEDFRIDFEDGYGSRSDEEEDGHARAAALEVAAGLRDGTLPRSIGIRIKPVTEELSARAVRTVDLFLTSLLAETGGMLPGGFVVTLPKVTVPAQADFFAGVLELLEPRLRLATGSLRFEVMVETPQVVIDAEGRSALPRVLEAGRGRIVAAHFGTYDYTAACGITAAHQHMRHPACDFARHVMQVAFAGTGIWLSDGSTTVLPVPPHHARAGGRLTDAQREENEDVVHRAWRLHYDDVRDSLMRGFYQGWDLHPAQLVSRYAAVFAFFLEGLDAAGERLRNFIEKSAQATLVGDVFDDAATGQGLLNYFLRGINAGAVTEEETLARTGLTMEELRSRSFVAILRGRRG